MGTKRRPGFPDIEKVMRELVLPFYGLERVMPLLLPGGRRWENDAEHSWSVALLACMLAPHVDPKLDLGKICQFGVVHDLAEVYAGDTTTFADEAELAGKEAREQAAVEQIATNFAAFPWLAETLQAYERQDTDEAKFVRAVDKVIAIYLDYVNEGLYYRENQHTPEEFLAFMERPRIKAQQHPGAFVYYEEVVEAILARPEFFHQPTK